VPLRYGTARISQSPLAKRDTLTLSFGGVVWLNDSKYPCRASTLNWYTPLRAHSTQRKTGTGQTGEHIRAGTRRHTQAHAGTRRHTQAHAGARRHTQAHAGTRRYTQAHARARRPPHKHTQAHAGTHRHMGGGVIAGLGACGAGRAGQRPNHTRTPTHLRESVPRFWSPTNPMLAPSPIRVRVAYPGRDPSKSKPGVLATARTPQRRTQHTQHTHAHKPHGRIQHDRIQHGRIQHGRIQNGRTQHGRTQHTHSAHTHKHSQRTRTQHSTHVLSPLQCCDVLEHSCGNTQPLDGPPTRTGAQCKPGPRTQTPRCQLTGAPLGRMPHRRPVCRRRQGRAGAGTRCHHWPRGCRAAGGRRCGSGGQSGSPPAAPAGCRPRPSCQSCCSCSCSGWPGRAGSGSSPP
jgi:hypothetical protein